MKKIIALIFVFFTVQQVVTGQQSLSDYMLNPMKYVVKVESQAGTLTIYGNDNLSNQVTSRKVALAINEVLAVKEMKYIWKGGVPISLLTVPFKVRPEQDKIKRVASSGLTNAGINFDLIQRKIDRYFPNGTKSTHKFAIGAWLAPTVEELDSIQTEGYLRKTEKSKQLFISTGLTLTYSYNNLTFAFVPLGFDYATSTIGHHWVYHKQRWWGFAIGIDPKIFAALANK